MKYYMKEKYDWSLRLDQIASLRVPLGTITTSPEKAVSREDRFAGTPEDQITRERIAAEIKAEQKAKQKAKQEKDELMSKIEGEWMEKN